jgi:diaminopimelate epimerase
MQERAFIKMHGLGNDFVVIDARAEPFALGDPEARAIADRRTGVGCDQLIVMEPPVQDGADVFMRIRNADGGEVEACGNATRCVAALIMAERGAETCTVETSAGLLAARSLGPARVAVDMGEARIGWREIPLSREMDTLHLALSRLGNDPRSPQRANIGVAQVSGTDRLRVRVWERGVGLTRACGTGACAAAVAAHRRGLSGREVEVTLDGGPLALEWREDGHVVMTGPVATSFHGVLNGALLP